MTAAVRPFFSLGRWDSAGQPTWRQALQPVHLSAMTFRAGLCLTVFSRAQGRREMTRDGSSTCNSASMAARVASTSKGSTVTTRRMPMACARASRSMATVGSPLMVRPLAGLF